MAIIEEIVKAITEFLKENPRVVYEKIEREIFDKGITVAEAWRKFAPKTPEEIAEFYKKTDAYLYDLLVDHRSAYRREIRQRILQRLELNNCKRILDYGGGVGLDSLAMCKVGLAVTFFDLEGVTSQFANWLFEKEKCNIHVTYNVEEIPSNVFDSVICVEVLEHVPDPVKVIQDIYRCLKMGGIALITESFEQINDRYLSHLSTNKRFVGKIFKMMENQGFVLTARWPDNKPLEFRKMDRNISFRYLQWKRRAGLLSDLLHKGYNRFSQVT
jgi:ubiquinone/menaquinone biosynthesis C-methylase UbiE